MLYLSLQEITGDEDIDAIVESFVNKEKENFALFNYVNELNIEVEKLQDDIQAVTDDINKCRDEDQLLDTGRSTLIKALEVRTRVRMHVRTRGRKHVRTRTQARTHARVQERMHARTYATV